MRKKIAAANWKMNCTLSQAEDLLNKLATAQVNLTTDKISIIAVPFPYLLLAKEKLASKKLMYLLLHKIVILKKVVHILVK
jgi:triosephosphate isomerase